MEHPRPIDDAHEPLHRGERDGGTLRQVQPEEEDGVVAREEGAVVVEEREAEPLDLRIRRVDLSDVRLPARGAPRTRARAGSLARLRG